MSNAPHVYGRCGQTCSPTAAECRIAAQQSIAQLVRPEHGFCLRARMIASSSHSDLGTVMGPGRAVLELAVSQEAVDPLECYQPVYTWPRSIPLTSSPSEIKM